MRFFNTLFLYPDEETLKTLEYQGRWPGDDNRDLNKEMKKNRSNILCLLLVTLLMAIAGIGNITGTIQSTFMDSRQLAIIGEFAATFFGSYVLIKNMGVSIDGIYTNGVTDRRISRFDILMGNGLHRYEDIKTIFTGLGMQGGKYSYYIQVSKRSANEKPTMGPFVEVLFENDFYKQLETTLRERCPQAEWVEKDLF